MTPFRFQPTGWIQPVTVDELAQELAATAFRDRELTTAAEDVADARQFVADVQEFERARIVTYLRRHADDLQSGGASWTAYDNLRFLADEIEKGTFQ